MSLSDYDMFAVDESGRQSDGTLTTPLGITVEVYKNWVYVSDPRAWRKKGRFLRPTVMQVWSGRLVYGDLDLLVVRGPQNGAYVVAYYYEGDKVRGMVACGVYAYDGSRYTGLTKQSLSWWAQELRCSREVVTRHRMIRGEKKGRFIEISYKHDMPKVLRKIRLRGARRYN